MTVSARYVLPCSFLALLVVSCGGEARPSVAGSAGSAGAGVAGGHSAAGAGGASVGGTGSGGTAGADPCGPAECASRDECTPVAPESDLITDFSGLDNDIFHGSGNWWLRFFGGPYVYPVMDACTPEPPDAFLTQELSEETWHVTGQVGTWSGIGLWFAPCVVDLSAYSGFSFTLSGDAGPSGSLRFHVLTASNNAPSTDPRTPTCSPNTATCVPDDPESPGATCRASSFLITDVGASRTVTVSFADLADGLPEDAVDPTEVLGILLELDWADERTAADEYTVDLVVDDVTLIR